MSSKELWRAMSESRRPMSPPTAQGTADPEAVKSAVDQSGKLRFIEGMRGVAALYVALSHLCTMVDPARMVGFTDKSPELMKRFVSCFGYGHLAVAIFIVISGFSLQLSLFASGDGTMKSIKRFYLRRAQRILPTYYACLVASLAVAVWITPHLTKQYGEPFKLYLPVNVTAVLTHVFMIHNWSPDWMYKINGVLWSIAIEVQLYVLFPILVRGLNRLGRSFTFGLSILIAVAALNLVPTAPKLYPWYLPLFLSGMVGAHLAFRPHLRIGTLPGVAIGISAILVVFGVRSCSQGTDLPVQDGLFGVAAACAMYAMTVQPSLWIARSFRLRGLTFIGGFSYTLYLMHHPIEQVMFWLKPVSVHGPGAIVYQFGVSLPVVILGTWLFSMVFEKPFLPKSSRTRSAGYFEPVGIEGAEAVGEINPVPAPDFVRAT